MWLQLEVSWCFMHPILDFYSELDMSLLMLFYLQWCFLALHFLLLILTLTRNWRLFCHQHYNLLLVTKISKLVCIYTPWIFLKHHLHFTQPCLQRLSILNSKIFNAALDLSQLFYKCFYFMMSKVQSGIGGRRSLVRSLPVFYPFLWRDSSVYLLPSACFE